MNALARHITEDSTVMPSVTPLMFAAQENHVECLKILLDNNANIHHQDNRGFTALHIAAQEGHEDIAREIIERDPSLINMTDNNNLYPIHIAALNNHCSFVPLLVVSGADVNILPRNETEDLIAESSVAAALETCAEVLKGTKMNLSLILLGIACILLLFCVIMYIMRVLDIKLKRRYGSNDPEMIRRLNTTDCK